MSLLTNFENDYIQLAERNQVPQRLIIHVNKWLGNKEVPLACSNNPVGMIAQQLRRVPKKVVAQRKG
jgi:hypothetical protein